MKSTKTIETYRKDLELLAACRSENDNDAKNAKGQLYLGSKDYCIRTMRKKYKELSIEDVEDIYQDAVFDFLDNQVRNSEWLLSEKATLNTYITTVCLNKASKKTIGIAEEYNESKHGQQLNASELNDNEYRFSLLESWMNANENCKKMFVYKYNKKLLHLEIAQAMGFKSAEVSKTTFNRCKRAAEDAIRRIEENA